MANLKELRNKINVVQTTRKVTMAMKLVAGVKFKKAENRVLISRPYAKEMQRILSCLRRNFSDVESELLVGRSVVNTEMFVVFASYKGLCGNFNYMINKFVRDLIDSTHAAGKNVFILCVGSKVYHSLKAHLNNNDRIELVDNFFQEGCLFKNSEQLAHRVIKHFVDGDADHISLVYNQYFSEMKRQLVCSRLIPGERIDSDDRTITIFEPNVRELLEHIFPYNIAVQIRQAALESMASEQSARMTAMDSATRNADEIADELHIRYNRLRQYGITQELTEIISGTQAISKG